MGNTILVTGSHRSGTTWAGKVLSHGEKIKYVHEPFNLKINRKYSPLTYWFECLMDSPNQHQEEVRKYINSFIISKGKSNINIKELGQIKSLRDLYLFSKKIVDNLYFNRTLLKDPIAIMSTEWIYRNLNMDVVVLIRHPAAFVASIKVKDWQFDFNNYLNQPSLMNNYLKDYEDLIIEFSENKKDIIDQGILLWNTIHHVIDFYQEKYKDEWCFVKHEDLSLNPIDEFGKIFSNLDLTLNSKVKKYINKTTQTKVKPEVVSNSTPISNVERNSQENIKAWKSRLSDDEILRIKNGTEKVWKKFYSENDW